MKVAPDLRPRNAVELYDAALHLCAHGGTALVGLSLLAAALPAGSGLWFFWRALNGREATLAAALFALSLMLRYVLLGAAALVAQAALEGDELSGAQGLKRALSRAPTLMAAGGTTVLTNWVLTPLSLYLATPFTSGLIAGPVLVARGDAGPFSVGREARRRISGGSAFGVRALHALAQAIVALNLGMGVQVALLLARELFGLDTAFITGLASPSNPAFLAALAAATFVLLEPVKTALGVLLLIDARVRREGLDLKATAERLLAQSRAGAKAAILLAVLTGLAAPARADEEGARDLEEQLERLGVTTTSERVEALNRALELSGPDADALRRFNEDLAELPVNDGARQRAREVMESLRSRGPTAKAFDARAAAAKILSGAEFARGPERIRAEPKPIDENWIVRLFRSFVDALRWLDKHGCEPKKDGKLPELPLQKGGLTGLGGEFVTWVLVGLAALTIVVVLVRALRSRREAPVQATGSGGGGPEAAEISALDKVPEGWFADADRLAAEGRFREAVRAVYLAVLSALHRRGHIDYDPAKSNWDYVRLFNGPQDFRPPFREMTRRFDFAWYGRTGADREGYVAFRALSQPVMRATERPDA